MNALRFTTDDELRERWEEALDSERPALIDRLAVENRTTRAGIRDALAAVGCCKIPEQPVPRSGDSHKRTGPKPRIDEARARALYDQGLSDKKIARLIGMSYNAVYSWRKRSGLPAHTQIVETETGHLPLRVDNKDYGHLPPFPRGAAESSGSVNMPQPEPAQEAPPDEAPLTLGAFRSVLTAYLPAALNEAELYLDGTPLLSIPEIVMSWGAGVPRVDVRTRRGE